MTNVFQPSQTPAVHQISGPGGQLGAPGMGGGMGVGPHKIRAPMMPGAGSGALTFVALQSYDARTTTDLSITKGEEWIVNIGKDGRKKGKRDRGEQMGVNYRAREREGERAEGSDGGKEREREKARVREKNMRK